MVHKGEFELPKLHEEGRNRTRKNVVQRVEKILKF